MEGRRASRAVPDVQYDEFVPLDRIVDRIRVAHQRGDQDAIDIAAVSSAGKQRQTAHHVFDTLENTSCSGGIIRRDVGKYV